MANLINKSGTSFRTGRRVGPVPQNSLKITGPLNKKRTNLPAFRGTKTADGCDCEGIDCWQISDPDNLNVCDFIVQ